MRRFFVYMLLQCKRALRLLPHMLAVLLLLACAAGLAAAGLSAGRAADDARQIALVGVVGSESDPYVRIGLEALETFDVSRDELRFVFLSEAEAVSALREGRLSAFLYLPDGYVESIYAGEPTPIRFITPEGAAGLDSLLTAELAAAVTRLVTETENAEYGLIRFVSERLPETDPYEADSALVDRYFTMVLTRDRLFSVTTVGVADSLSFGGYYFCGILVAFLLLAGIGASPFCARRSAALGPVLSARGFGPARQTLGEFAAFYLLLLLGALAAAAVALPLLRRSGLDIPELRDVSLPAFFGTLALLVLCIGAMQFFLYELVPSVLGGILLQFLAAAAQGYVCGCFYPYSFFPDALQRLGAVLPAGRAIRCMGGALRRSGEGVWAMLVWVPVFLLLSAGVRALRRDRTGGAE